jgi:CheY-like chemotaxis protein
MITPRVLDLNKTLADSEKMLHRLLGEDVHVHLQLDTQLPRTVADPGQVHQIIMNLAVNARDAMPNGGEFTFRTTPVEFHEQDLAAMPDVQSGRYVCLAVSDTGHGMSREVQEHIFEPFFTTKGLGKGTGLGLAVIYGIVKQSRGWIHVYSQKGLGTTFKVYLPAHVCELTATNRLSKEAGPTLAPGKGERILLVEDEPSVRALAHRICLKAGYKVTVCVNAQEGFDQWTKAGGAFDLLFSDVVLPDFTGIELAERLRAQRPTLPVLLCSGYSDERSRWSAIAEKKFHYLQKPYPASTLLQAIRQALTVQAA